MKFEDEAAEFEHDASMAREAIIDKRWSDVRQIRFDMDAAIKRGCVWCGATMNYTSGRYWLESKSAQCADCSARSGEA